jgi:hypothetical protein
MMEETENIIMNTYKIVGKFECCGEIMITVMMNESACVMPEREFNRIIETERKWNREYKVA